MYKRNSEKVIIELLQNFRILYLTCPRQAGKTTLVRKIAQDLGMQYISLDEQAAFPSAQNDQQGFIDSLANQPVLLDEFQYAPELFYLFLTRKIFFLSPPLFFQVDIL